MSKQLKRLFGEISKAEQQEDGTLIVEGFASAETVDSDGETITAQAIKAAIPDYMKFGAVREMHDAKKAAGTAIEIEVQDDGKTAFKALVVDSEAIKKVLTNVYKGFSIGGKVTSRDSLKKSVITGLNLLEVSLVDRPANPDALFTMFKAEGADSIVGDEDEQDTNDAPPAPQEGEQADKAAAPGVAGDVVQKGMHSVSRFADMLESLCWLYRDAKEEAAVEGDNSPVPAALREWVKQGASILSSMAAEEVAEFTAGLATMKAAKADDLAKAGARFSKSTKATLAALHKALKDGDEMLKALAYEQAEEEDEEEDEGAGKAASADDLAKAAALSDDLAKAQGALDEIGKACAALGMAEGGVVAEFIAKQGARITELEAQPDYSKGQLKNIEKSADVADGQPSHIAKARQILEKSSDPLELMKAVHTTGGRPLGY